MGGGRILLSALSCLVALAGASCAGSNPSDERAERSPSSAPDFMDQVAALCPPVAEEYESFELSGSAEELDEAADVLTEAERDLAKGLRALEAPVEIEDDLDAYVDALEESSEGRQVGDGGDERESLAALVASARAGVRMEEISRRAGLPDECPPPSSVNADNTLFVARANLECFDLYEDAGGEPFDPPRTAKEVALTLDLARRLTARIAGAVKRSAPSGVLEAPVEKIVRFNKKRFHAIDELEKTFEGGDYRTYRKAGRKLMKVSRKADRKMMSLGLVYCAKAFSVVPL